MTFRQEKERKLSTGCPPEAEKYRRTLRKFWTFAFPPGASLKARKIDVGHASAAASEAALTAKGKMELIAERRRDIRHDDTQNNATQQSGLYIFTEHANTQSRVCRYA